MSYSFRELFLKNYVLFFHFEHTCFYCQVVPQHMFIWFLGEFLGAKKCWTLLKTTLYLYIFRWDLQLHDQLPNTLYLYISDEIFNSPINSHENLEETVWSENVAYERASLYKPNKSQVRNEPWHEISNNLTSVDSEEPLQPPFKLRNSKWCSAISLTR